jgi:hypothetical protein
MSWVTPDQHRAGNRKSILLLVVILVAAAIAYLWLASRSNRPESSTGRSFPSVRCVSVSGAMLDAIATGLTASGDASLVDGRAVRSTDFSSVYFVAARIRGPGMGDDTVGIWATNDLQDDGPFFAVDGYAHEFSDWGRRTDVSQFDDGAQEAKACALARS